MILENQTFIQWIFDEPTWLVLFAASAAIYAVVRLIKKQTRWLVVKGR